MHVSRELYTLGMYRYACISMLCACTYLSVLAQFFHEALKKELHDEKEKNKKLEAKIVHLETMVAKLVFKCVQLRDIYSIALHFMQTKYRNQMQQGTLIFSK